MPTKLSSYLTELGFRQIEHLGDVVSYNKENGGEYIVVKENNRLYRYDANSTQPVDNLNVTPTLDGGNTRWIAVGGAAMTQTRVVYTFTETSNTVPLGMKVLAKANILYVNIHNTQILSDEFSLNSTKDAIILSKSFEAGVKVEVVIVIGDFTPDPYDYTQLSNLPRINGVVLEGDKSLSSLDIYSKSEVDTKIAEKDSLPDQTENAGKVLSTDGTTASWENLPEYSINNVKLEGNKTLDDLGITSAITTAVENEKTRAEGIEGGLKTDLTALQNTVSTSTGEINTALEEKQDKLTAGSGINISEDNIITNTFEVPENVVTSENYVNSKLWKGTEAEYSALGTYDDAITYIITDDNEEGSSGSGTSNYEELENKPSINGVTLEGNKSSTDLQLVTIDDTNASTTTVYSSNKVNTLLNKKLTNNLHAVNVDLNTLRETGIYAVKVIYSFGHSNLHLPYIDSITKNATWIVDVNRYGGIAQVVQTAYIVPSSQISPYTFRRYSTGIGDSWSEWYQIAGPGLDMPSNKTVDISLQASGATYTAEANGYVSAACGSWNDNARIALNTSGILYNSSYYPTAGAGALSCSVPVSKGQAYSLVYENTTPNVFKFTYANSEVPMNERYPDQEVYTSDIVVNVTVNGTAPNATEFKVGDKDFTSTYNAYKEGNVYFQISHVQEEIVAWSLTLESGTATPSSGEITLNGSKITIDITVDNAG